MALIQGIKGEAAVDCRAPVITQKMGCHRLYFRQVIWLFHL